MEETEAEAKMMYSSHLEDPFVYIRESPLTQLLSKRDAGRIYFQRIGAKASHKHRLRQNNHIFIGPLLLKKVPIANDSSKRK